MQSSRLIPLISIALLLSVLSCKNDSNPAGPTPPDTPTFTTGPATQYPVNGSVRIADSLSGGTFIFKDGSGVFSIARLLTVPDSASLPGSGFMISYTGSGEIRFEVSRTPDTLVWLWAWGKPEGSASGEIPANGAWLPLPARDTVSDPAMFDLVPPGRVSVNRGGGGYSPLAITSNPVWLSKVVKKNPTATQIQSNLKVIEQEMRDDIDSVLARLSPTLRATVDATMKNDIVLPKPACFDTEFPSFYHAYTHPGWLANAQVLNPYFCFVAHGNSLAPPIVIAHEVGHFMSHVLVGDATYRYIALQAVEPHDLGNIRVDRPMIEEFAFWTETVLNNHLFRGYGIKDPLPSLNGRGAHLTPMTADFPSVEGFGCGLLLRLWMTSTAITTLEGAETIPVAGLSDTDIYDMFGLGPWDLNDLYGMIKAKLALRQKADVLPAIMERCGWSYHGYGTIVDGHGAPIAGATVQALSKVASAGTEFLAPQKPVITDALGKFSLGRVFPGDNYVRVTIGGKAYDVSLPTVDPEGPTNEEVNLGTLVVQSNIPIITSVTPGQAEVYSYVDIKGRNFGRYHSTSTIYIGDVNANGNVVDWSDTLINVMISDLVRKGPVAVVVGNVRSNEFPITITSIFNRLTHEANVVHVQFEAPFTGVDEHGAGVTLVRTLDVASSDLGTAPVITWKADTFDIHLTGHSTSDRGTYDVTVHGYLNPWNDTIVAATAKGTLTLDELCADTTHPIQSSTWHVSNVGAYTWAPGDLVIWYGAFSTEIAPRMSGAAFDDRTCYHTYTLRNFSWSGPNQGLLKFGFSKK